MMNFSQLIAIILSAILVENLVFVKFLGVSPFWGPGKRLETAISLGLSVTVVMTVSSIANFVVGALLRSVGFEVLNLAAFVLIAATVTQLLDYVLQRTSPTMHAAQGVYLPLVAVNTAVLGAVMISNMDGMTFFGTVGYSFLAGLGFLIAVTLFASVRERLDFSEIPNAFEGIPIALITAGLISMAFMGFAGMRI